MQQLTGTPAITPVAEEIATEESVFDEETAFIEDELDSSSEADAEVLGDDDGVIETVVGDTEAEPTKTVELTTTGEEYTVRDSAEAQSLLLTMILTLVIFGAAIVLIKHRDLYTTTHKTGKQTRKRRRAVIGVFILFGLLSSCAMVLQLIRVNGYALAILQ